MKTRKRFPFSALLGGLLGLGIIVELLRPKFNPVSIDSANRTHEVPAIVSLTHAMVCFLMIIFPVMLGLTRRTDLRRVGAFGALSALLVLVAALSLIGQDSARSYLYVVMLALVLGSAMLFSSLLDAQDEEFRKMLAVMCLAGAAALIGALSLHEFINGRLASRAGPTYWGAISMICFCIAPSLRQIRVRAVVIVLSWTVMILASARGAILASAVAAVVQFAGWMRRSPREKRVYFLSAILIFLLVVPFGLPLIANALFDISDPRRGLDSGATGRAEAWAQALKLFYEHPVLGMGYRQHEQFITVATSAHQAYLAVLAEMGLVGLTLYLIMLLGATARQTIRMWQHPTMVDIAGASYLWAYIIIGFTENYALATGLPMPLVMLFIAARAWTPAPPPQMHANVGHMPLRLPKAAAARASR